MTFRVRIRVAVSAGVGRRGKGKGEKTAGQERQTGPMCVCSAAENNVHSEALMRFKNNGDYLHYSLGITRGDVRFCASVLYAGSSAIYTRGGNFVFLTPASCRTRVMRDTQTRIARRRAWQREITRAAKQCRGRKLIIPLLQFPPPPPSARRSFAGRSSEPASVDSRRINRRGYGRNGD